jgi:hypothetical protein
MECVHSKDWFAIHCPEINTEVNKYLISFVPQANTNLAVTPRGVIKICTAIFAVTEFLYITKTRL